MPREYTANRADFDYDVDVLILHERGPLRTGHLADLSSDYTIGDFSTCNFKGIALEIHVPGSCGGPFKTLCAEAFGCAAGEQPNISALQNLLVSCRNRS